MFARSGRSAFVCLRCQHRLANKSQRPPCVPRFQPSQQLLSRRWHSAAAALVEETQDIQDDEAPVQPLEPTRKRSKISKTWKPSRTAELGVPSLGKPAEVILLKERDRSIPETPNDAADGVEGEGLSTAWNTEKQPLSPEQLVKNIEHIRDEAKEGTGPDLVLDRRKLRKRLEVGFSTKQLRGYIEQRQGPSTAPFKMQYGKNLRFTIKRRMARYIFRVLWAIQGLDAHEKTERVHSEESQEVRIPSHVLEVLLQADSSSLKQISLDHKVHIDFFRQPTKIIVSGTADAVETARQSLLQIQQKVCDSSIDFPEFKGMPKQPLLDEVAKEHGVYAVLDKGKLKVCYLKDSSPDLAAIRQSVSLWPRRTPQAVEPSVWPRVSHGALTRVQVDIPEQNSSVSAHALGRLIVARDHASSPSVPQMSTEHKSTFVELYAKNRQVLRLDQLYEQQYSKKLEVRHELTASFGQAVLQDDDSAQPTESKAHTHKLTRFACQIPLLAQYLAKRKPMRPPTLTKVRRPPGGDAIDFTATTPTTHHHIPLRHELLLTPTKRTGRCPSILVQLEGANHDRGLNQPLQIRAIMAILDSKMSHLLLPGQTVDIAFQAQVVHDIYREGAQSLPEYANLLKQLAVYFDQAGALSEPRFAPFLMLDVPPVFSSKDKVKATSIATHEYVLESSRALDIATYAPPFRTKLCLEHIVYHYDDQSHGGIVRQTLQLVEQRRLGKPVQSKTTFRGLFGNAYELALSLGSPGLLQKS